MITVFTPTYNRANLLPRLYESLCAQDCKDFEWFVIDDGSVDDTGKLFDVWSKKDVGFSIHYVKVQNGGKQRAINKALEMVDCDYFFIVDSDDILTHDAISFIYHAFNTLPLDDSFIGVSVVKGDFNGRPLFRIPQIDSEEGFIDCNNIERPKYGLQSDMAEVYYTDKLKKYKFPVWKGETFTPEAVVWDRMAMDGYRLRWFSKVAYLCEYQEDGLTNSTWKLLKHNPMGYAMLFNTQLMVNEYLKKNKDSSAHSIWWTINVVMQFVSCCSLVEEYAYLKKCQLWLVWLLLIPGLCLGGRRRWQLKKYCK